MIRFIMKRRVDNSYGCVTEHFETLDLEVPTLEQALTRGGVNMGGPGYALSELVGVEILAAAPSIEKGGAQ